MGWPLRSSRCVKRSSPRQSPRTREGGIRLTRVSGSALDGRRCATTNARVAVKNHNGAMPKYVAKWWIETGTVGLVVKPSRQNGRAGPARSSRGEDGSPIDGDDRHCTHRAERCRRCVCGDTSLGKLRLCLRIEPDRRARRGRVEAGEQGRPKPTFRPGRRPRLPPVAGALDKPVSLTTASSPHSRLRARRERWHHSSVALEGADPWEETDDCCVLTLPRDNSGGAARRRLDGGSTADPLIAK